MPLFLINLFKFTIDFVKMVHSIDTTIQRKVEGGIIKSDSVVDDLPSYILDWLLKKR